MSNIKIEWYNTKIYTRTRS